jgi:hypothetical protein
MHEQAALLENSACAGDARSGGGLREMTRRKIEFVRLTNERDFAHLVELALPPEGFRDVLLQIDAFHRERCRREVKPFYIRFCFPDIATCRCISRSLR